MSKEKEVKYVELAVQIRYEDWENMYAKVKLCAECEIIAFGIDGFISKLLEKEEE